MPVRDGRIQLVGLDVGSTTTRVAIADAHVLHGAAAGRAGRPELGRIEERLRTEPARTPFRGDALDEAALLAIVDGAIADGGAAPGAFFGGGALLTGLAARAPNAAAVVEALRPRVGDAIVATAGDPRLEAWLAFHGNAAELSRGAPERFVLNVDIGGGTTNLAVGRAGEVVATGWMWIGARHVEVEPGSHRVVRCSPEARRTLQRLGWGPRPGDELSPHELGLLLDAWLAELEGAVTGDSRGGDGGLVPARLELPAERERIDLAFSGGVGGLVYDILAGRELPPTTAYGDLGIEIAERIARSPVLGQRVLVPEGRGRATVYGLLRHQTQLSGATVFVPSHGRFPAGDLPILGALEAGTAAGDDGAPGELARLVALARAARPAGAIVVRGPLDGRSLRDLGRALGAALRAHADPDSRAPLDSLDSPAPLVVLIEQNLAKALGGYATEWGHRPLPLIVLDEVSPRGAALVRIGAPHGGVVPLSFFGMGS
jgi:ethanolamine utilization protein EutA